MPRSKYTNIGFASETTSSPGRTYAGWTVPASVDALAAALPVARDGAAELAAPARARYLDTFTPEQVTKRLLDVYATTTRAR